MSTLRGARVEIRCLNDRLRRTGLGGRIVVTEGLAELGPETVKRVLAAVSDFSEFGADNDPHEEHDCASLTVDDLRIIWKIDYYDLALQFHSPDPADPDVTVRVLTIMLAEEY